MHEPVLPPFSGDTPTCIKCGGEGARTRHRADATGRHVHAQVFEPDRLTTAEHLERECERCDYRWAEDIARRSKP